MGKMLSLKTERFVPEISFPTCVGEILQPNGNSLLSKLRAGERKDGKIQ